MIKYIVGSVIVILAWVIALLIDFPLWIPLLVTLVVALVLVLLVGLEKLRERRAARELEKALAAQAQAQAASARPDLQHEIAEMQAEFQKAISALKTSKKGGKKALYALPWYAIIGPPGCGKSTALRNSGLEFPYLSASGGGVRGLGGTRNCDWWMTSNGVILDTAGRWTSEDEDHDEWIGFLDLIRRFRPKKPLNGMIAAVSVDDVGGAREDEVAALARRIRDRIDEVQGRLKMSLPVYVLFTKCDLIPGFVETFGDLPKQDRGQIWGFTRPLAKKTAPPREYFLEGFDKLVKVLTHRSVKRMGEDRKISNRELIYAFPQQIEVLRGNMAEFCHALFSENVFRETPLLRGVYFTSGTQEGRPIDRVMSKMAQAFGQPDVQLPAPQVEAKSYFLRDVFSNVVFKDAEVAVRSPEEIRRQRVRTWIAAATLFGLSLAVSGFPALAWAKNRAYLEETRERIDAAREVVVGGDERTPLGAEAIEPLRQRAVELGTYDRRGPPLLMSFGMYQGRVHEPVRAVYLDALRRRVVGPLLARDGAQIHEFEQRLEALGPTASAEAREMREMYERLKLHIVLTVPRADREPDINGPMRDWVVERLKSRWREATEVPRHDPRYPMMEENLRYYVNALGADPALYFPRDMRAVGAIRGAFNLLGNEEMAVHGIIDRVERRHHMPDVTLRSLVGRETSWLRARAQVRAAFTRPAWEQHVQTMIDEEAAEFFREHWVLGNEPPENEHQAQLLRERQVANLRAYFLEKYVEEWQGFIDSLWVATPSGDQEHVAQLTELTSLQPQVLTRLVQQVAYHVNLTPPAGARGIDTGEAGERARRLAQRRLNMGIARTIGITSETAGRLTGTAADRLRSATGGTAEAPQAVLVTPATLHLEFTGFTDFAPPESRERQQGQARQVTPARRYEEQLEFLRDALRFRISGTNVTDFTQRQRDARALTTTLIDERPYAWRPRFRTLLMPPIEGSAWVPPPVPAAPTGAAATPAPTGAAPAGPEPTLPAGPEPTLTDEPAAPRPPPRRRGGAWWQ
ncbi:MAG: type VI secretion system membrane subunit TssM [Sandaracinaceae bacterium]|nr:type VI secretion system membrane subunit TssM [Sandaracinaceae bacterium]